MWYYFIEIILEFVGLWKMKTALVTVFADLWARRWRLSFGEGVNVIASTFNDKPRHKELINFLSKGRVKIAQGRLLSFDFEALGSVNRMFSNCGQGFGFGRYQDFDEINVKGTKRIIDYAIKAGSKFLSVSQFGRRLRL